MKFILPFQSDYFYTKAFAANAALDKPSLNKRPSGPLPTRAELMKGLREEHFDILVIGGGATGAGVALDAQTRGIMGLGQGMERVGAGWWD